jgi:hypothetical protein
MSRMTIWTLVLTLALASAAGAAPTPEEQCQAAKLNALRKRSVCSEGERRKEVLGKTPNAAKCEEKFATAITKADENAAATSCRWLDNADGTATDLNSGLQWELKTDDGSVHDKDNFYSWNTAFGTTPPDGTAFTVFLGTLNGGVSSDGTTTTGCFAGHCDWRLPTVGELRSILAQYPCTMSPCTTIPGFTQSQVYWSSSTYSVMPDLAWFVSFSDGEDGGVFPYYKPISFYVRGVRGAS